MAYHAYGKRRRLPFRIETNSHMFAMPGWD